MSKAKMTSVRSKIRGSGKNSFFKPIRASRVKEIRKKLMMNQQNFWSEVGVTQSGGSRYENGRVMPKPVRAMVRILYAMYKSGEQGQAIMRQLARATSGG